MSQTIRLTMAQALVRFLSKQYVERDGIETQFFAGVFGIFGHGNVAGIGQALEEYKDDIRYYQARNEQAMVHAAIAYTKVKNRMQIFACTTSIGPGATNMITGAATATVNRLPVLLLPGDIFASRKVAPVLQQLESEHTQDTGVNNCFQPVSRYWDRIYRPEQLVTALPEVIRVLTSPAETGAVTLCLPQDVQCEAFDYPIELFEKRVHHIPRIRPEALMVDRAVNWIRQSKRPLIIAGGGVIYSGAHEPLAEFAIKHGIPVGETQAGKGSLRWDHPYNLGAVGVTGTSAANAIAKEADLVINVGTRLSDFTTMSKTIFKNPDVKFIGMNVNEFDAHKHSALPIICDAKSGLHDLSEKLTSAGHKPDTSYISVIQKLTEAWHQETERLFCLGKNPISQSEVIGVVTNFSEDTDIMVCAAGSLPGDLHKLWRTRDPKGYHLEYGYSCMGYEIAGALGAKMADPEREVYVLIGDGSYLMLSNEIMTSVQEGIKLIIVLMDNHGFNCIRGLASSCGSHGFGNQFRHRNPESGLLDGDNVKVDFMANAASLGAEVLQADSKDSLRNALAKAKAASRTSLIYLETNADEHVPGYDNWWDVAIAEVSSMSSVNEKHAEYVKHKAKERYFLTPYHKD